MRAYCIYICLLLSLGIFSGCTTTHFLGQAACGQWNIKHSAVPIAEVLEQSDLSPYTREQLEQIHTIKQFAQDQGLFATDNYEMYVEVKGEAPIWVVTACPPLSLAPKTWSFPVAGSFTYLGWFHEEAARAHGEKLTRKGYDVHVRSASAYSTLGHFKDPVFSTMLSKDDTPSNTLINTLFHESAHGTIYVKDQSYFNESVASFIGDQLTIAFLKDRYGDDSIEVTKYQDYLRRVDLYNSVFHTAYMQLDAVYQSEDSEQDQLKQKEAILQDLQAKAMLKAKPNNAALVGFKTYSSGQADFQQLYETCGLDWDVFLKTLSQIAPEDFETKHAQEFGGVLRLITAVSSVK